MTTKITIDAHAGWPVRVGYWKPRDNTGTSVEIHHEYVDPFEKRDVYIHSGQSISLEEVQIVQSEDKEPA